MPAMHYLARAEVEDGKEKYADFSTDEKYRETLTLLSDTLGYLRRLPANTVTRDFCNKIEAHLAEPTHRLVITQRQIRSENLYTPAGIEWFKLSLQGHAVTAKIPPSIAADGVPASEIDQLVITMLRRGATFNLDKDKVTPSYK